MATEEEEAARKRKSLILLIAGGVGLLLPLAGLAFLKMRDKSAGKDPGAETMNVFQRRMDASNAPVAPISQAAAVPEMRAEAIAVAQEGSMGAQAQTGSSLGFITGAGDYKPTAQAAGAAPGGAAGSQLAAQAGQASVDPATAGQGQAQGQTQAQGVPPAPAEPPAPAGGTAKKAWAPPKLGSGGSKLKAVSWGSQSGKGGAAAAAGAAGGAGGLPPGVTPDMMKMMQQQQGGGAGGGMPGMPPGGMPDMSKMMGGAGGAGMPGMPPGGMPDMSKMMGGAGGAGGMPDMSKMMQGMPAPDATQK